MKRNIFCNQQMLLEDLEENHSTQIEIINMGQTIANDVGYDPQLIAQVLRHIEEVNDQSDRLRSTLNELESTLSTLHDTVVSFDSELEATTGAIQALGNSIGKLEPPIGLQPKWVVEQKQIVEVNSLFPGYHWNT